jgi:chromosome segregation ATPase
MTETSPLHLNPTLTNNASSQIMQIANRIQQKATTLTEEQNHLSSLQNHIQSLTHHRKDQTSTNQSLRKKLLQQLRSRHGIELELLKRKQDLQNLQGKIDKYRNHIIALQNDTALLQQRSHDDDAIYTPHLVKIELFQRNLDHKVNECRSKRRKREEELDALVLERETNLKLNQENHEETDCVQTDIAVMKQVEVNEDEEIASLSMQIRMTVSKRISLRSALKDARDRNEKANMDMVQWEENCIQKIG